MWQVHNKRWYTTKPEPADAVYIGRPRSGDPASPLANPFSTESNPSNTVTVVADPIESYRCWLWEHIQDDTPQRQEVSRLVCIPDGVLLCWCKPRPCHGDIVARAVEWFRETQDYPSIESCRSCGVPIHFGLTLQGKPCPYNVINGVVTKESHFATCPDARTWSKK